MEDDHLIPLVEGNVPISFGVLLEGGPMTFKKRLGYILIVQGTKYNNLLPKIKICCIVLPSETTKPYFLITPFSRILE